MSRINCHCEKQGNEALPAGRQESGAAVIASFAAQSSALTFALIAIFLISSCGSAPAGLNGPAYSRNDENTGMAKMVINRSKSADIKKSYGIVKQYRVTITGPGIEDPIIQEFSGEESSGVVAGVPAGEGRVVAVEAVNPADRLIRAGEAQNVVISPGAVSEVEVEMDAIPIFVNLEDDNVITDKRLKFELFADPEDPLEVRDNAGSSSGVLFDLATGAGEIYPDVSSGLATMVPNKVGVGEHVFTVVSKRTERSSSVRIKVIDGSKIRPAPLYSGGNVQDVGGRLKVTRAGFSLHVYPASGAAWPNYLEAVLTEY